MFPDSYSLGAYISIFFGPCVQEDTAVFLPRALQLIAYAKPFLGEALGEQLKWVLPVTVLAVLAIVALGFSIKRLRAASK